MKTLALSLLLGLAAGTAWAQGAPGPRDWPSWRGPQNNGHAAPGQKLPIKWSETENVAWKSDLPGRGHSSPTIVGQRIYLATADEGGKVQSLLGLDRKDGKILWKTDLSTGGFPPIHAKNTHATCTPACDGERVYAVFLHHDKLEAVALSLDGKIQWKRDLGPFVPKQYQYGYAPSPILYRETLIVSAEFDGAGAGYLTALDRKTGEPVWKTPRPAQTSYSSPVVGKVAGKEQLLISGCNQVSSYDPSTGKSLWSTPGTTSATCGTMVWEGDLVFASGGYPKPETLCVKADGSGTVVWKNNQKCYEQSMLTFDGHVYALNDNGIAFCWKGSDGSELWKERLRGPISASPVFCDGVIYQTNEHGTTYVFKATPEKFELLAENQLGNEGFATLAACGGEIFLRAAAQVGGKRQETLYCLRAK
jgi:outer membrane protein assembly factor BamB